MDKVRKKLLSQRIYLALFALVVTAVLAIPIYTSFAQSFSYEAPSFDISLNIWSQNTPQDRLTVSLTSVGGGSNVGVASVQYVSCPEGPMSRVINDPYYMENSGLVEILNTGISSKNMSLSQKTSGSAGTCGVTIGEKGTFTGANVTFNISTLENGTYTVRERIYGLSGDFRDADKSLTISRPTNGQCGGAERTYGHDESFPGSGNKYCESPATQSPTNPSNPSPGGETSWTCPGSNGGDDAQCTAERQARLSVNRSGTGSGTVSASGISCGSDCSQDYDPDTNVSLSASPSAGSSFAGWSGACSGTGTCSVTMNADKSVTATFNAAVSNHTLSINSSGASGVAITGNSSAYDGTTNYTKTLAGGTSLLLTAPWTSGGKDFASWSGCDALDASNECRVNNLSADKTVTANYTDPPAPTECTVVVSSNQSTTWSLTGPESRTQSSPSTGETYSNMDTGTYTLAANPVAGYTGPSYSPSSSQTCTGGDTITFNVSYEEEAGPESETQCSDGVDNDGDGFIDFPDDPDCIDADDDSEATAGALACSPESQDAYVGEVVRVTGSGGEGSGSYTWSAPGGTPSSGSGQFIDVQYSSTGSKTVTLDDGVSTDQCTVSVIEAVCGNDICEGAGGETCSSCSVDCGVCPAPECSDGEDNDGDGFTDYPNDPECKSSEGASEKGIPSFEEF